MRISSTVALALIVSACGRPDNEVLAEAEERAAAQAPDDGKIECAVNGDSEYTRGCETERLSGEDGVTMVVRHPDGGFRRFRVLTDGRGLEAADGAETAKISIVENDKILVTIGPDKYIMPARMKAPTNSSANADIKTAAPAPQSGN